MAVDAVRAKMLFLNASEVADSTERADFLERECGGDVDLKARVEALLRANDADPLPHENPAPPNGAKASAQTMEYGDPSARIGATLAGKYKLIEEIGEGGMGTVYMAQQTEPVKRAVAVKVIKPGMDSRAVMARFEAERQALAMMDHPNIARVLDAGTTPGGRPFFVMELVKGQPITRFCDERKLTPRQRLELFVPVCQAIQHAHQKGVIHRDVKPSNVIVAMYDDKPVPKVIDFGVAKAAGQSLTDKTLMTGFGAVVGTPEYMSPEQANLNNMDIDTRSDVYSLGVLLYELLTGSTPLDRKSFGKAALMEILRLVREVEVPRPSAKISTIDTLPSIAANRGTEPGKLSNLMKGELDWVLLKALEKDRARRYDTANALARDIQRYLADEVVEARPPSTGYRVRKFARKHRGLLATASAFAVVLMLATAFSAWQAYRASMAEAAARKSGGEAIVERNAANQARDAEAIARRSAEHQRLQAEANFKKAREAVDEYFVKVGESTLLNVPGLQPLRKELLESARKYYEEFLRQRGDDPSLRAEVGAAHYRVGIITELLGTVDQARPSLEQAREIYLGLTRDHPTVTKYWVDLAICNNDLGRFYHQVNDRASASRFHQEAREIRERNAKAFPNSPRLQDELVRSYVNLSDILTDEGKPDEGLRLIEKAVSILETATKDESPDTKLELPSDLGKAFNSIGALRVALAHNYLKLGALQHRTGRLGDAPKPLRKSLSILEALLASESKSLLYQGAYSYTGSFVCAQLDFIGHGEEAAAAARKVKVVTERLLSENPSVSGYRSQLATLLSLQGKQSFKAGRFAEAVQPFKEVLAHCERLRAENPRAVYYQHRLASACRQLGLIPPPHLTKDEGLVLLRRAETIFKELPNPSAGAVYDLACVQALLVSKLGKDGGLERDRYEATAMESFRRAVGAGYKHLFNIRTDTDLDPLRHRDDFKKLMAELESEAKTAQK
jgi:eukaryotic-like serine/threonine-protein kinase